MLGKPEPKAPRPRGDGKHCDLCGCSFPAVRCDKCGSQIFCLSCDDMYHRHPKRRFHLRKAVDPAPTSQARPVLPMKASQLAAIPGDPSKMPLPPPRKKKPGKSFFDNFRRGSPPSDHSPPLPKKEYSWSDRLGNIRKFMSNRPLPPLPKEAEMLEQSGAQPEQKKNDMSFIHKRVDEKPPQLPHRVQSKSPARRTLQGDLVAASRESPAPDKRTEWTSTFDAPIDDFRQAPLTPPTQHLNGQASRDSSEREISTGRFRSNSLQEDRLSPAQTNFQERPSLPPTMPPDVRGYSTLKRAPALPQDLHNQSFMSVPGDHFPGMHSSSSVTDLHSLDSPPVRGHPQFPNYPIPPHYPYPMYPHYPNYPQYFGTSFANLATGLTSTDGDFSDNHSDAAGFSPKKHSKYPVLGMKAKRSQSVMYDRMAAYPPQFYPFGGYPPHPPIPGYGAAPWGQSDRQIETPPSPATSVRSYGRTHRSRQRKKKMAAPENEDADERLSVRSSPRSRTTSSSDRLRKRKPPKKLERSMSPSSLTSSEEQEEQQSDDRLAPEVNTEEISQGNGYQTKQEKKKGNRQTKESTKFEHKTKQQASKMKSFPYQKLQTDDKNFSPKFKKKENVPSSASESMDVNEEQEGSLAKNGDNDTEEAEMRRESQSPPQDDGKKGMDEPSIGHAPREGQWQCEHCTFINSGEHRICQVCCKTRPGPMLHSDPNSLLVPEMQASSSVAESPDIPALNTTSESLTSDTAKEFLTPPAPADDDGRSVHSGNEGQNFEQLNSDLEQAEKELSRGLMELMKLKEESNVSSAQATNRRLSGDTSADKDGAAVLQVQPEPKPLTPTLGATLAQFSDKPGTSSEELHQQNNIPKIETVYSKSIGTDAMDFRFPTQQERIPESVSAPAVKAATSIGAYAQGRISPARSLPETVSPLALPDRKDPAEKSTIRRDSSCQTHQEVSRHQQMQNETGPFSYGGAMDFQYPYNRAESMRSPQLPPVVPPAYRGFRGRGQGLMHRSHSRSSLFGERYSDTARNVPPEFDNLGFGFGPSPMYRSGSRSSLTGDYADPWMSDTRSVRRPDFYLSMEELVERRRLETKRAQGLELVRMIREAEQQGFTADDIHVALNNCGKQNPVDWLQTNWRGMVDTVVTLATNYGKDKHENDIGVLSENEARDALRMHKGNIWAAVTECVEGRQRKFLELKARGNFSTREIVDALTQSEGNVELAYTRLSATTLKPFLMRIWGAGEGVENQDGAVYDPSDFLASGSTGWTKDASLSAGNARYADNEHCSDQEDWEDDDDVEEEVSWNDEEDEDEMEGPENFNIEPETCHREKRGLGANQIATPESDSEYCDAFDPVRDVRSATSSSPADEIFFVSPDSGVEPAKEKKKGTSFLSRLAALRKNKKPQEEDVVNKNADNTDRSTNDGVESGDSAKSAGKSEHPEVKIRADDSSSANGEANKIYGPLNLLKQTFSAIKESVIGSNNKNEIKHPRSITEARTIIVHDRTGQGTSPSEENNERSNVQYLKGDSLPRGELKDVNIISIASKSESKDNAPISSLNNENLEHTPKEKALPVATTTESGTSTFYEGEPSKQHRSKNSQQQAKNAADASDIANSAEKLFLSPTTVNKSEESSQAAQNLLQESVDDVPANVSKSMVPERSKQNAHDKIDDLADLKTLVKDRSRVTQLTAPEKPEDGNEIPEQQKYEADKILGNAASSGSDVIQNSSAKSIEPSNQMKMESHADLSVENILSGKNLPATATENASSLPHGANIAGKPLDIELATKKDLKPKTKKAKEGLRLKLPVAETATDFQDTQQNRQAETPLSKVSPTPNADNHLQQQKALEQETAKAVAMANEIHPLPRQEGGTLQKPKHDGTPHDEEVMPVAPSDVNRSETGVKEKIQDNNIGRQLESSMSENEFHDMASKIAEKMENCLEVLKSSETVFTETKRSDPSISDKEPGALTESKSNFIHLNSGTSEENADQNHTDERKKSLDHAKEGKQRSSESPSFSEKTEELNVDYVNQITDKIIESSVNASSTDSISSDIAGKHTMDDIKQATKQPSSSGTYDTSEKPAEKANEVESVEKVGPPTPDTASSTTTKIQSDSSEIPVIFPGVKAKTFTGASNKKVKSHVAAVDKTQKSFPPTSPVPKVPVSAARSEKASDGKEDFVDGKQGPLQGTETHRDGHVTQPHQSETESDVHLSSTSKEEKVSTTSDQLHQVMSQGNRTEIVASDHTQGKNSSTREGTTTDNITVQAEQTASQSNHTSENTGSKVDKQAAKSATTAESSEASIPTPSKNLAIPAKEEAAEKFFSDDTTEAKASASNKSLDADTKKQTAKSTSADAKTQANASGSGQNSDIQVKVKITKKGSAIIKTETFDPSPTESLNIQAKFKTERNLTSDGNAEARVSSPNKQTGVQTKEGTATKILGDTNSEQHVPSNKSSDNVATREEPPMASGSGDSESSLSFSIQHKESDGQANRQDTKAATSSDGPIPSYSKGNEPNTVINDTTGTSSLNEDSVPSSPGTPVDKRPSSRVDALRNSYNDTREGSQGASPSPLRPQSPFGRMTSLTARKEAIAQERSKEVRRTPTGEKKPWFIEKVQPAKPSYPKRSIKQQLEFERKIRKLVSDRKCRTYRKAEIVVQLLELNFAEEEALQAAHECSTLEQAISYLQQECLLCTGMYPVGQIVSMIHCPHNACRECIKAYFTIQIRDRTIMELLCPFCNEPDISDEDVAQDYFNHLDILLKKLVEPEIHELFQRKLRDRVLMKDPNFRWCSQCSSGFIAEPNLKRLICPDCNAITCASCRHPWEREHEGVSCEAFGAWKDANDPEAQTAGLAKLLQEDGIDCPNCHFRYSLAKGGCMHFRCIQCQHDFCSGCSKPFKMGQKCGVSDFCGKLGLHAHHPRNCLFYLRDKDPEDLQRLLELNDVDYNKDPPEGMELKAVCQVMEQKETSDGLVDDVCGKEVQESQAGLCRVHYVEYLGQLVNKHRIDPIQIFCNDDLELVLKRASKRLPAKSYRDSELKYREKLVQLIQEELPLEKTEGS